MLTVLLFTKFTRNSHHGFYLFMTLSGTTRPLMTLNVTLDPNLAAGLNFVDPPDKLSQGQESTRLVLSLINGIHQ